VVGVDDEVHAYVIRSRLYKKRYRDFLERVKHSAVPLEPTPIVDLVWHTTHQQFPARYAVECRRIAGSFMDHSD